MQDICKHENLIKAAAKTTLYDVGNEVLYDLCARYPKHTDDKEIIAKVWLIGRSYAVALERNKNKQQTTNDDFYQVDVLRIFKDSKIDSKLNELESFDTLDLYSLRRCIQIHDYLTTTIQQITKLRNRSFCSKYLHFHFRDLFYIYDSRAVSALKKLGINSRNIDIDESIKDREYALFCHKCFRLQQMIFSEISIILSTRQLDNFLLELDKSHG